MHQDAFVCMQYIYVYMQDNHVYMQDDYVYMADDYVMLSHIFDTRCKCSQAIQKVM